MEDKTVTKAARKRFPQTDWGSPSKKMSFLPENSPNLKHEQRLQGPAPGRAIYHLESPHDARHSL